MAEEGPDTGKLVRLSVALNQAADAGRHERREQGHLRCGGAQRRYGQQTECENHRSTVSAPVRTRPMSRKSSRGPGGRCP